MASWKTKRRQCESQGIHEIEEFAPACGRQLIRRQITHGIDLYILRPDLSCSTQWRSSPQSKSPESQSDLDLGHGIRPALPTKFVCRFFYWADFDFNSLRNSS